MALAAEIGADGRRLLDAIDAAADRPEPARSPEVEILRRVWATQYVADGGRLRWRANDDLPPCAEQVCSPYDPDARYSMNRPGFAGGWLA